MLVHDPKVRHIVCPSWADAAVDWKQLPERVKYPDKSGVIPKNFDAERLGYPSTPQPVIFQNGLRGGGLVSVLGPRNERWLGGLVLVNNANMRFPDAVRGLRGGSFDSSVFYLEPYSVGIHGSRGRMPVAPICTVSPEHFSSSANDVYWVIGLSSGELDDIEQEELAALAEEFDLRVDVESKLRADVAVEASLKFAKQPMSHIWFRVQGGGNFAGRHFAWMIYVAFRLKQIVGGRMRLMHLVAKIQGSPSARQFWPARNI